MDLFESTTTAQGLVEEDLVGTVAKEDLVGTMQLDIAKAMRRLLENKNISLVVKVFFEKKGQPMSFGELQQETQLKRNDLNHALLGMKEIGLVTQLKDRKYALTLYCATILKAMNQINSEFMQNRTKMHLPVKLNLTARDN
jgi:hypothetical protein